MPEIAPLRHQPEVVDFLLSRRSRPAKSLRAPGPDREALREVLTAAARVPDHGKLEPWRFIVIEGDALGRLADLAHRRMSDLGQDGAKAQKARAMFADAPCIVAVICAPQHSDKIPDREQLLSAGAACTALVNMALASGWGANWLTGAMATDSVFLSEGLDLEEGQSVAGFIVLGTEGAVPPERPRPDLDRITRWIET
ncbi:nitroreductase family protein [Jannaschia aquimarina]|uniref:Putative NAD(P)H nitroreductase n=1 Tax=Jannaschia aquimarina TaxID=935700 RepID=A0A0D1CRP2_9RHOB|nr:nitroreductase [Jannaschia aquimarina]KIT17462.1 putative NAD(P)H nitroreductase YdjA [Jannaschia aquimarina]SNS75468.1 Nitroreductase [Jannaschia aquimarina]